MVETGRPLLRARLETQSYAASPTNAYAFASTGGDGVTFSLVDIGQGLRDDAPVVMTVPMALGDDLRPNWILGRDLREFLALGLDTGWFGLEQLAYDPAAPERIEAARSVGRQPLLDALARELGLSPWAHVRARLDQLAATFEAKLRFSARDGRPAENR